MMKRLFLIGAAALTLVSLLPDEAAAQRGMRGVSVGGVGGRGVAVGGGAVRAAGIGGYRGAVGVGGGYGIRSAAIGSGAYAVRGGAWRPGLGVVGRPGLRVAGWRGSRWGWGFPIAAGIVAAGAYGYYGYPSYGYPSYDYSSYDGCLAWDGYQWVNTCYYQPPAISGGGQYLPPY
jgi:hypothetical protein